MTTFQPVKLATKDPEMVTKGWLPAFTVLVVMLVTLLGLISSGVSHYGNHLRHQADIEVLSSSSPYFSMMSSDDNTPQYCANAGVFSDLCSCVVSHCESTIKACDDVDACRQETHTEVILNCFDEQDIIGCIKKKAKAPKSPTGIALLGCVKPIIKGCIGSHPVTLGGAQRQYRDFV